jgi:hypothetical protein
VKIMCPHGHRVGDVTRDGTQWLIELVPDVAVRLGADGQITSAARYPAFEPLLARPLRILACPRECMLENSWYRAESAELERRAAARYTTHRLSR